MCDVLLFPDESSKLKSLLSESNPFDSLLFIFSGSRRYKLSASSLGVQSPCDLLLPLGSGLFRSSPFWKYYFYPCCRNFNNEIHGLCGEVLSQSGSYMEAQSCHIFVDRSRRQLKILYRRGEEYIVEHRALSTGVYQLKKSETCCSYLSISWDRVNKLLTVPKKNKVNKKTSKR